MLIWLLVGGFGTIFFIGLSLNNTAKRRDRRKNFKKNYYKTKALRNKEYF